MRPVSVAFVSLIATACADPVVVSFSSDGVALGVLAIVDQDGRVSEASALHFDGPPVLVEHVFEGGEGAVAIVSFDLELLRALENGLDEARIGELGAAAQPPPVEPLQINSGLMRHRLPSGGRSFVARVDGGQASGFSPSTEIGEVLAASVSLDVPIDPRICGVSGAAMLSPRGPSPGGLLSSLDSDRVLVATSSAVEIRNLDGDRLVIADLAPSSPLGSMALQGMKREGAVSTDGRVTMWIVACPKGAPVGLNCPKDRGGYLQRVVLGPDGLESAETASVTPGFLSHVAIGDGELMALGQDGRGLRLSLSDRVVHAIPAPRLAQGERAVERLIATGDPARPFLISTRNAFSFYDRAQDRWFEEATSTFTDQTYYGLASTPVEGGVEIWAVGTRGALYRKRPNDAFRKVDVSYPKIIEPCLPTVGVEMRDFNDVAIEGEHVYVVIERCNTLVQLHRSKDCAGVVAPQGEPVGGIANSLNGLEVFEHRLLLSREGRFWVRP